MNTKAPDFTLPDQDGNKFNLYENLNKHLMLVFYPKDDSVVCTKQLCNYNENLSQFNEVDITVIAVSTDSVESHKKFRDKYNLNFPLLSDKNKRVSKEYNALNLLGMSKRKIVIISPQKEIVFEDTVLPVNYRKPDFLLDKIKSEKN